MCASVIGVLLKSASHALMGTIVGDWVGDKVGVKVGDGVGLTGLGVGGAEVGEEVWVGLTRLGAGGAEVGEKVWVELRVPRCTLIPTITATV